MNKLTYDDKLLLLKLIEERCQQIRQNLQAERTKKGMCPHARTKDISTFKDMRKGHRLLLCLDCREVIEKPILSKGEGE